MNEEELRKEIAELKKENEDMKKRLKEVEEILSIIEQDMYLEFEMGDEDECAGCEKEDCSNCEFNEEE